MKKMQTVTLTVLVCLVVSATAAVIDDPAADISTVELIDIVDGVLEDTDLPAVGNRNLNVGFISGGDLLLHRQTYVRAALTNAIQTQDIRYLGSTSTRVTAVRVNQVGVSQGATARIVSGGLDTNNVTVRLTSARGRGWNFSFEVWGRL